MERNYSIDFVKFFAIFAVVCIHTRTLSGVQIGTIHGDDIDFIIDTLARFAVPFFFVTSGYLFVQKIKSITKKSTEKGLTKSQITKHQLSYFRKYTVKLMKLYLAWFIFYFLFELGINFIETEKTAVALKPMFTDFLASFNVLDIFYYGSDSPQYHLWFLLALIWSVIILFVFVKINILPLLVFLSLGLNIYGLFGQSYTSVYEVTLNTRDALFFGLFYTALGGIIGAHAHKVKAAAIKIPVFVYISLLLLLAGAQLIEGYITVRLWEGNDPNYFLATIPLIIFLFLAMIKYSNIGKNTLLSKIGANAVGIYVSHLFIMEIIRIMMTRLELTVIQQTVTWKLAFTPIVFILAYLMYAGIQTLKNRVVTGTPRILSNDREGRGFFSS